MSTAQGRRFVLILLRLIAEGEIEDRAIGNIAGAGAVFIAAVFILIGI